MVVSGPSGVGKSSVVEGLAARYPFHFSVSATTRRPRGGERHGVDYWFVEPEEFDALIAGGELLEWAEYSGHRYGTPRRPVVTHLERGENVLLDIENRGAKQVKDALPEAVLIFLLPPSRAELERRLRSRGDTTDADVARRLEVADAQIETAGAVYDHLVRNDDLDAAIDTIADILASPADSERP